MIRSLSPGLLAVFGAVGALVSLALSPVAEGQAPVQVWAITASKVYHCPKSRWYGKGDGRVLDECRAIGEGFKPAFGRGCGSRCPPP